jgi:mutator protein MutT
VADTPKHSVAVVGVVIREDGRVLVVQRRDNGRWEAPGGVLELGETFEEGVRREVFEEAGVTVDVERLTGVYKNLVLGVVALAFLCSYVAGTGAPTAESQRVEWLTLHEVRQRLGPPFAVRVLDALTDGASTRAHDGVQLVNR